MNRFRFAAVALLATLATTPVLAGTSINGLAANALTTNALTTNALTTNATSPNGLPARIMQPALGAGSALDILAVELPPVPSLTVD